MLLSRFDDSSPSQSVLCLSLHCLICLSSDHGIYRLNSFSSSRIFCQPCVLPKLSITSPVHQNMSNLSSFSLCFPPKQIYVFARSLSKNSLLDWRTLSTQLIFSIFRTDIVSNSELFNLQSRMTREVQMSAAAFSRAPPQR